MNGLVARVGYSTDSSPNPYWDSIVLEAAVTDVQAFNVSRTATQQAPSDKLSGSWLAAWLQAPAFSAWVSPGPQLSTSSTSPRVAAPWDVVVDTKAPDRASTPPHQDEVRRKLG